MVAGKHQTALLEIMTRINMISQTETSGRERFAGWLDVGQIASFEDLSANREIGRSGNLWNAGTRKSYIHRSWKQ